MGPGIVSGANAGPDAAGSRFLIATRSKISGGPKYCKKLKQDRPEAYLIGGSQQRALCGTGLQAENCENEGSNGRNAGEEDHSQKDS